jgi:hypothetical protein
MGDIITLRPNMNIPETLRAIADEIEQGIFTTDAVTLIAVPDIFQIGTCNDNDAVNETILWVLQKIKEDI